MKFLAYTQCAAARVLFVTALLIPLGALAADLRLSVVNAPLQSTLYVALYDSADAYADKKALDAKTVPVQADATELAFVGLAPGRYAVRVYADENGNATLDSNLMGMPVERYGFTNDAQGKIGPPDFEAAAVSLDADKRVTIRLR